MLTLSAAVVAGAGLASFEKPIEAGAVPTGPRLLHTAAQLRSVRAQVLAGLQPWTAGRDRLVGNSHSRATWAPRPLGTVVRGGDGQNYAQFYNDIHAAYQNALRWHVSGDDAHAAAAAGILNAWSGTLTAVNGNADRFLAAGIYGHQFAVASDLLRSYSGFDLARAQAMLLSVFYPMNDDFLKRHNGAHILNYWANWDLCNMNSILAIGILCDRADLVDQAVSYFMVGGGNGSIKNAVPIIHPDGTAQWQESGRDQGHTMMGMGQMGAFCEMAWNQGIDLYGYDDSRFLKAAEYVAKYNLGNEVPFQTYHWYTGTSGAYREHTVISDVSRGQARPVWELIYNHYVIRRGLPAPHVAQFAAQVRPEGGGGDYGPDSGGFDQLGFGTLAFSHVPATPGDSWAPPSGTPVPMPEPQRVSPAPSPSANAGSTGPVVVGPTAITERTGVKGLFRPLRKRYGTPRP